MSQSKLARQLWLDRAISTYNYHCDKRADNDNWTVAKTALSLHRSVGGVSEDILVANWIKMYGNIDRFTYFKDALEFIRSSKKERMTKIHLD